VTPPSRFDCILSLLPRGQTVIDVGADHGYVAHAVNGIATERMPHRRGKQGRRWVVMDGLSAFRDVEVAVIAGMGALTIDRILRHGPRPRVIVVHAPDDPQTLRARLAQTGWRIEDERLAPEAGRFAEIIRLTQGQETTRGLFLEYGPVLLRRPSADLVQHLEHHRAYQQERARLTAQHDLGRHTDARERIQFLEEQLRALTG
jgi:tRNA A22 N-methylase